MVVACCSHWNRSSLNSASLVFGRDDPIAQPPRSNDGSTLVKVRSDFMGLFPAWTRGLSWRLVISRLADLRSREEVGLKLLPSLLLPRGVSPVSRCECQVVFE